LGEEFWRNQDYVGARLTVIALTHPEMFAGIPKAKALPSLKVFVADKDEEVAA
jgi:hypothetical protein